MDVFHKFYERIEEIQGVFYKNEPLVKIKCDTSFDSRGINTNENSKVFESDEPEYFDTPDYFDNDGKCSNTYSIPFSFFKAFFVNNLFLF